MKKGVFVLAASLLIFHSEVDGQELPTAIIGGTYMGAVGLPYAAHGEVLGKILLCRCAEQFHILVFHSHILLPFDP